MGLGLGGQLWSLRSCPEPEGPDLRAGSSVERFQVDCARLEEGGWVGDDLPTCPRFLLAS